MITEEDRKLFQEAFDKSVRGILAQGRKSYETGGCAYRGEDGCKCAIGQLIPDEEYDPLFECLSVEGLRKQYGFEKRINIPSLSPFFDGDRFPDKEGSQFLARLQHAHDYALTSNFKGRDESFVGSFKKKVAELGTVYGLDLSVLEEKMGSSVSHPGDC